MVIDKTEISNERLEEIIASLANLAALNFNDRVDPVNDGSAEDVLLNGINMLAEVLEEAVVPKNKYQSLFDQANDGIFIIDKSSNLILDVNKIGASRLGFTKAELIGRSIFSIYFDSDMDYLTEELVDLESGGNKIIELKQRKKNGDVLYVELSCSSYSYDNHDVIQSFVRDISERKKSEFEKENNYVSQKVVTQILELSHSNVDLESILNTALKLVLKLPFITSTPKGIIFLTNEEGVLKMVSQQGLSQKAINKCQFVNFGECLCGDVALKRVTKYVSNKEREVVIKDTNDHYILPIIHEDSVLGVLNLYLEEEHEKNEREITILEAITHTLSIIIRKRQIEQGLIQSEERFRGLIENSSEITCVMDELGVVKYASPSTERVLGYSPSEMYGKSIFSLVHKDEQKFAIDTFKIRVKEGGLGEYRIYRIRNAKGEYRYLRMMSANQLDNPSVKGFVINAQDVTEMTTFQRKLEREHTKTLKYQSMLLSSQLNPHFIFNSLNSIQYFIMDKDTEPALNYLSNFATLMRTVLDNSTKRYITLEDEIKFLNIYLRLEEGRHKSKFGHTINFSRDLDPKEILIPPMLLQPFIENTVIHGVGHLINGGVIEIFFEKGDNEMLCTISDNGVGRLEANRLKVLKSGDNHVSQSTGINSKRIDILNSLEGHGFSGVVEDLYDEKGKPTGTKVIAKFPLILEES